MRVSIIYNPRSGRGKAHRLAQAIHERASNRGHTLAMLDISRGGTPSASDLTDTERLIIVGGDGTVHHLLPLLMQTQVPFQHCGTGTANLICRALNMSRKPAGVLNQLEEDSQPRRIDVPRCNNHPFLIMTSLGFDASVIHRLEESRKLGGYRAYIRPVLREILSPHFARVDVTIDGTPRPEFSRPGVIVTANMPNYGGHFNPCRNARWDDQQLSIAHIRGRSSVGIGIRFLALRASLNAATRANANAITLESARDTSVQIDGEKPSAIPSVLKTGQSLSFTMSSQSVYAHAPRLP